MISLTIFVPIEIYISALKLLRKLETFAKTSLNSYYDDFSHFACNPRRMFTSVLEIYNLYTAITSNKVFIVNGIIAAMAYLKSGSYVKL